MEGEKYSRIEKELEIKSYLQNLHYALQNGAKIQFQVDRHVDDERDEKYTNRYTVAFLFPDEDPLKALKRELLSLTVENYIQTVIDRRFPGRSEMREFGKVYNGNEDVYIKIRVELFGQFGSPTTFVMSFHFAETAFSDDMFPYRKS